MTLPVRLGVYGLSDSFMPGRRRNVFVNDGVGHGLGSVKFGQRCQVRIIRSPLAAPNEALVVVNAGFGPNPKVNLLSEGGLVMGDQSPPLDIFHPEYGSVITVRKLDPAGTNFEAYLYPVDGTNESDRFPPMLVDTSSDDKPFPPGATGTAVPLPPGIVNNDLLLAWIGVGGVGVVPVTPAGWTLLGGPMTPAVSPAVYLYARIVDGLEANPTTWQNIGAGMLAWSGIMQAFRIPHTGGPPYAFKDYGLDYPQALFAGNGPNTDPFAFAIYTGQMASLPEDTRFVGPKQPFLQAVCFACVGAAPSANPIFQAGIPAVITDPAAFVLGGGDATATTMLMATCSVIVRPTCQWTAFNLDPTVAAFPWQGASITAGTK
jgi:hypothetical protein